MTFKESVIEKLIICASQYAKLIGIDFVVTSNVFSYKKEYIFRFHKDNFLHLTGVATKLTANEFFIKCLNKTIDINDFDCESSGEIKGKVKEKLKNLILIGSFFDRQLIFQESFEKNKVKCKIATSDGKCTLGFIEIKNNINIPLTLLNGNQINPERGIVNIKITKKIKQ